LDGANALVALLGLFSTLLGMYAMSNRHVIKAYQTLVGQLNVQVDRLSTKVRDLERTVDNLMGRMAESRNKSE